MPPTSDSQPRRLTVVYNPVKVDDLPTTKAQVASVCERHGWDEPTWVETTEDETGERQARDAVDAGAHVVASLGGDGTVRAVASALVGTDVALGLLPGGTGNLLARNLELPVDSIEKAAEAMVRGQDQRIDVGVVWLGRETGAGHPSDTAARLEPPRADVGDPISARVRDDEEIFLVMAGLGFDGEVMADTDEKVKAVVGWVAYALSAARKLVGKGFPVDVQASGDGAGVTGRATDGVVRHARSVVVGNCGTLQGGIELMPAAEYDDGVLDAVVVAPRGPFGWASVIGDVVSRHHVGHARLDRLRGTGITVRAKRPVEAEIDGDPVGEHDVLTARVLEKSLVVRVG